MRPQAFKTLLEAFQSALSNPGGGLDVFLHADKGYLLQPRQTSLREIIQKIAENSLHRITKLKDMPWVTTGTSKNFCSKAVLEVGAE